MPATENPACPFQRMRNCFDSTNWAHCTDPSRLHLSEHAGVQLQRLRNVPIPSQCRHVCGNDRCYNPDISVLTQWQQSAIA